MNSNNGHFMDLPRLREDDVARIVSEDVTGCLSLRSRGAGSEPVMVLDVDALLSRCVDREE